jgi:hypothetical protein
MMNNIDASNELNQIAKIISHEDLHQGLATKKPLIQYRHARKTLINSRIQSEELRDNHLDTP